MKVLRSIVLVGFLLTLPALSFSQGLFYVQSNTVTPFAPNNCSATQVDVITYLGCINFINGGSTFNISNDTIFINVKYTSSPICAGAISQPVFNVSLDTLPAGNYTIASNAVLDATTINTVYTPISVASCCSASSNLEAIFTTVDSIFCEGERIQLTNQSINAISSSWFVNNVLTSTLTQPFLDSLPAGSYSVRLQVDSAACSDDTTISFTVNANPTVDLGPDTIICQGSSITLRVNNPNAVSYLWQDSSLADTLNVTTAGVYYVSITDSLGCSGIDSINVLVSVCTGLNEQKNNTILSIFPNPINKGDYIWITTNHAEAINYDYQLLNISGQLVDKGQITLSRTTGKLELNGIEKGIFFLRIEGKNKQISTSKVVIK
tara:strand:- start:6940 stop:8073 length:1134 start_codon:yes stop_codon:yes gene_type:complete